MRQKLIFISLAVSVIFFLIRVNASGAEWSIDEDLEVADAYAPTKTALEFSLSPLPQWINPEYPEAEVNKTNASSKNLQILPIPFAGYQDTYGFLGGAALALYDPANQTRLTTSFLTNFDQYVRYKARFEWRRPGEWLLNASASLGNDIQHYYGEGDNTSSSFQKYLSDLSLVNISYQYALSESFYVGPSIAYGYRNWTDMTDPPNFANESEFRVGAQATWDDRSDVLEPRDGSYYQVGLFTLPSVGNSGFGTDVWQLEGDARKYFSLFHRVILATRANFGWTMTGQPSYSYEYTLGGTSELRGFNTNRFRGLTFYDLQAELRFPLFDWLAASTGIDAGDITSSAFTNAPLASWQVGLRSDTAEQLGIVFRVDMGFSYGGSVFIYSINEPF
jgi:outer membrane protein assembly factor BamA